MNKIINYKSSFFHGFPINKPATDETAIKVLESILRSGYLFNRETLEQQDNVFKYYPFSPQQKSNENDEISISVFPGINSYTKPSSKYSAFQLTNERFYLILSQNLNGIFQMREGNLAHEFYLKGNIPLKDYLLGIGNAGYEVNHILNYLYYIFKYYNGEISLDEFILKSERYWEYNFYREKKYKSVYEAIDNDVYHSPDLIEKGFDFNKEIESYIYKADYYLALKDLCKKYGIDMFDSRGNLVDEQSIYSYINEMRLYVKEQFEKTSEERKEYIYKRKKN